MTAHISPTSSTYGAFVLCWIFILPLQWRHNECDDVSNHGRHDCLFNRWFRRRSNKTSKLRVTGLCEGNSPVAVDFPVQMASTVENVSIWLRHHAIVIFRGAGASFTNLVVIPAWISNQISSVAVGWYYLSLPNLLRVHVWILGMG